MSDITPRQMISDIARDVAYSEVPRETHDERSKSFSRTIVAAEATYRHYISCKGLFPIHKQEYNWAKSVWRLWPVAYSKTRTRFSPPGDLIERIQLAVADSRISADVKAKFTPLVEGFYGFEKEEVSGNLNRNAERVRNLKGKRDFQ